MPTIKPRIAVTLNQNTFEVIARMAALHGRSRGSVVAELLDSVAPSLSRTVALMEAAAQAPKQVRDGLRAVVENTHDDLVRVSGDAIQQLDFLLGEFSRESVNPHVVTRGSGLIDTPPNRNTQNTAKPATARPSRKNTTTSSKGVGNARQKRKI